MSIMNLNKPAETETQPVFRLHGIPYYPKHLNAKGQGRHKWVGPGREHERKEYTTTELTELGAELVTRQLWKRSWTDEVQGWINI
jgi:hypothetical protein